MLSRALSLATVMLLIGCFAADKAQAQATNLEAGKSSAQIFAGTCTACHKSPRGLLRTVAPGSLPGFLRQHYTTSSEMAGPLSAYLISNGATDTRAGTKQGKDAQPEPKPSGTAEVDRSGHRLRPGAPAQEGTAKPEPQQAARPDADGISPQAEPGGRQGRNGKRLARPEEAPDAAKPLAEDERGPDGRKGKLKLGKRGKPGSEEPPKTDAVTREPAAGEPAKDDKPKNEPKSEPKSDAAKDEGNKPEGAKPSGEAKSEPAKSEPAKSEPAKSEAAKSEPAKSEPAKTEPAKTDAPKAAGSGETPRRADPVPAVTPAPKSAEGEVQPAIPAPSSSSGASGAASPATAEPVTPPPAVTALAPPPAAPAGPPTPPISQ
jgi:hypothetical protein